MLEPQALGRNPFWLQLIVRSGAFEGNRGQILNTAVDTLLAREWDEKPESERAWRRMLPRHEQLGETKQGLSWLGYSMSLQNKVSLDRGQTLLSLAEWLSTRIGVGELRPQDILGLGEDGQVLVYGTDPTRFRHRLIQEFMAAWMLKIEIEKEQISLESLVQYAQRTDWWETLFLLGGLLGADNSTGTIYRCLVLRMLESKVNEQSIFMAIGLLLSVESPPSDLANTVTTKFISSIDKNLTENQQNATRELVLRLGQEAITKFASVFDSSNLDIKKKGAALLCAAKDIRATEVLLAALSDSYVERIPQSYSDELILVARPTRVTESLEVLISLGTLAVEPLLDILFLAVAVMEMEVRSYGRSVESWMDIACGVAMALGEIGDLKAVEPLVFTLHSSSRWLRKSATDALRKIGAPAVVPLAITTSFKHEHARFSNGYEISASCIRFRFEDYFFVVYSNEKKIGMFHGLYSSGVTEAALEALRGIGAPVVVPLIQAYISGRVKVDSLVEVLSQINDRKAVELLVGELLNISDSRLRASIPIVLEATGEYAVDLLIGILCGPHKDLRIPAIAAIGRIGKRDQRAVKLLEAMQHDSDENARKYAADTLAEISPKPTQGPIRARSCYKDQSGEKGRKRHLSHR